MELEASMDLSVLRYIKNKLDNRGEGEGRFSCTQCDILCTVFPPTLSGKIIFVTAVIHKMFENNTLNIFDLVTT